MRQTHDVIELGQDIGVTDSRRQFVLLCLKQSGAGLGQRYLERFAPPYFRFRFGNLLFSDLRLFECDVAVELRGEKSVVELSHGKRNLFPKTFEVGLRRPFVGAGSALALADLQQLCDGLRDLGTDQNRVWAALGDDQVFAGQSPKAWKSSEGSLSELQDVGVSQVCNR